MLGKARFAHIKALAAALLDTLNLEPNVGVVHNWGKGRTLDNWLGNGNTAALSTPTVSTTVGKKRRSCRDLTDARSKRRSILLAATEARLSSPDVIAAATLGSTKAPIIGTASAAENAPILGSASAESAVIIEGTSDTKERNGEEKKNDVVKKTPHHPLESPDVDCSIIQTLEGCSSSAKHGLAVKISNVNVCNREGSVAQVIDLT